MKDFKRFVDVDINYIDRTDQLQIRTVTDIKEAIELLNWIINVCTNPQTASGATEGATDANTAKPDHATK